MLYIFMYLNVIVCNNINKCDVSNNVAFDFLYFNYDF